jgi:hypothetical protein
MALYNNELSTIYDKEREGPTTIIYGIRWKGMRIVQADAGSDSDSESRKKNEENIPVNCLTDCPNRPIGACHQYTHLHC